MPALPRPGRGSGIRPRQNYRPEFKHRRGLLLGRKLLPNRPYGNIYDNLARIYGFSVKTPWKKLSEKAKKVFLYGTEKKWTRMHFVHPVTGADWMDHVRWRGVLARSAYPLQRSKERDVPQKDANLIMSEQVCPECHGERLKPYPAATLLSGKRIAEITQMTIAECFALF